MRFLLILAALVTLAAGALAQPGKGLEKPLSDALRDVHDQGRRLYNDLGDPAGAYRMYQGGLLAARGVLGHRPDLQRLIADGLAAAESESSAQRRAFALHELIERVRADLRGAAKKADALSIPPREVRPTEGPPRPSAAIGEVKGGVVGRVIWMGQPVAGVDVTFVTLGRQPPRVYETTTGPQGVYAVPGLKPGKYVVLITPGKAGPKKLPERYATSTTSPLVFDDVKGGGEKLDFILQ